MRLRLLWTSPVILACLALAGCGMFHKVYTAKAEIQVTPNANALGHPNAYFHSTPQYAIKEMQSEPFLIPLITDLSLDKTWTQRFDHSQEKWAQSKAIDHLRRKVLTIEVVPGTSIVNITARSEDPQEAVTIANAVANRYKALRDAEQSQRIDDGIKELRIQIADQEKTVAEKKAALDKITDTSSAQYSEVEEDYKNEKGILDVYKIHLKQMDADRPLIQSPVTIVSLAELPRE